jgi:hypothetical protein
VGLSPHDGDEYMVAVGLLGGCEEDTPNVFFGCLHNKNI